MDVYLEENLETCYNKSENERVPLDFTRLIWSSRCESFSASAESCKYFWELLIMSSAVLMSRASCLDETCLPKSENLERKNQGMTMTWGYIIGIVFHHNLKHCQRHNGPEGWVLLTKVTSLGHITSSYTNLDQTSSESRPSTNFKISTKHQHFYKDQNLDHLQAGINVWIHYVPQTFFFPRIFDNYFNITL